MLKRPTSPVLESINALILVHSEGFGNVMSLSNPEGAVMSL